MKDLLEFLVKALVDDPSEVQITETEVNGQSVYEVRVAKTDIGKIIGKRGRTATAIRTILTAVSTKHGKRTEMQIVE